MFGAIRASRRDRVRRERRARAGIKQLRSGTVVQLQGIPFTLVHDTDLQTNPANWALIQFDAGADRDNDMRLALCYIIAALVFVAWFALAISASHNTRLLNDRPAQQHFAP